MSVFQHLVEWEQIFLRISGQRLQDTIARLLRDRRLPITDVELNFEEGSLNASAKAQKGLSIPIRFTIREILADGTTLRLVVENLSTYGSLPVPKNLLRFIDDLNLPDGLAFDSKTMTLTVKLDRFLPPYLVITVNAVRFIPGGLLLHLGEGSADPPP